MVAVDVYEPPFLVRNVDQNKKPNAMNLEDDLLIRFTESNICN